MEKIKTHPINFLNSSRFDILAKYIYAKSLEENAGLDFGLNLYSAHLKVWNNCEYGDDKNGLEEYIRSFKALLKSIKEEGFNPNKSLISVSENMKLLNGGHRVAACLLYKKDMWYKIGGVGQTDVNYEYFKNKDNFVPGGLSVEWCDAIATEYCKIKPNTLIATVFPSAQGRRQEVEDIIKKRFDIFYKKTIYLFDNGPLNLMKQMYRGEAWGGDITSDFPGLRSKASLCFQSDSPTTIYVITAKNRNKTRFGTVVEAKNIKEKVRNIFNIGNHSIHINDNKEETLRLAKYLLNK